jgi:hypothetical protein
LPYSEGFGFLESFGLVDSATRASAAKWAAKPGVNGVARTLMTLKAGRLLRASTPPKLKLLLLLLRLLRLLLAPHVSMSIYSPSFSDLGSNFECLFSMTLLEGALEL